jgi:hypothetical protein
VCVNIKHTICYVRLLWQYIKMTHRKTSILMHFFLRMCLMVSNQYHPQLVTFFFDEHCVETHSTPHVVRKRQFRNQCSSLIRQAGMLMFYSFSHHRPMAFLFSFCGATVQVGALAASALMFLHHTHGRIPLKNRRARSRGREEHPCPRQDSNPGSQESRGCRPTTASTSLPPGLAPYDTNKL